MSKKRGNDNNSFEEREIQAFARSKKVQRPPQDRNTEDKKMQALQKAIKEMANNINNLSKEM